MFTDQEIIDIQVKRIKELTAMYLEMKAKYEELLNKVEKQLKDNNG